MAAPKTAAMMQLLLPAERGAGAVELLAATPGHSEEEDEKHWVGAMEAKSLVGWRRKRWRWRVG